MQHITLIENSHEIEHKLFQDIFNSKLHSLKRITAFFERYEINATIHFTGLLMNKRLQTRIIVECEDDVFRRVIEENVLKFNSS